jgi:hypothetical protein
VRAGRLPRLILLELAAHRLVTFLGRLIADNARVSSDDGEIAVTARRGVLSPAGAMAAGAVVLVFTVSSVPLAVALGSGLIKTSLAPSAVTLAFWVVGVLVARREPHNPIGWMLIASGALVMIGLIDAEQYSLAVYVRGDHGLPFGDLAVIVGQCWPAALLFPPLAILLFPDGQLPSRRWKWVVWLYAGASTVLVGEQVLVALNAIRENRIRIDASGGYLTTPAPRLLQGGAFSVVGFLLFVVIVICWVLFVARRVVSYRRATGVRRQQLKWVMCGSAVTATAIPLFAFVNVNWLQPVAGVAVAALPIAIGVGILRYRLYEIDVIIRKTLVYAALVAILSIVYLGGIYLIDRALQVLTGESGALAVTVSTLAVAVAFQPLRIRLQTAVDHRFYRRKYDAAQTLDGFAGRLRDQIELDALTLGVLEVINVALQPRHASIWLKPHHPRPTEPSDPIP